MLERPSPYDLAMQAGRHHKVLRQMVPQTPIGGATAASRGRSH